MYLLNAEASSQCLEYAERTVNIDIVELCSHFFVCQLLESLFTHRVHAKFYWTYSLHHSFFKARSDSHYFACSLHLSAERFLCVYELIKRPLRELYYNVVKRRLKASVGLACYLVYDLVKRISYRYLCCNLCYRIACSLWRKRRNSGVYLDYRVFKAVGLKCKLTVTAALDLQCLNDIQRRCSQHLIFLVCKRNRRSDNDTVACMNADRVEVFHRADGDNVALCVTDNLELDFLPARNTLFNKYLCDRRKTQTVCCNLV